MTAHGKTKKQIKNLKMAYGGLLTALGILLPQAFHVFGQNAGMIFLPMHIPVLFAGLLLGSSYGAVIGAIVPVLSFALTGMPAVPKLYFMMVELIVYGTAIGFFIKKTNVYWSLIAAMICGRICYGAALLVGVFLLHMHAPFMNQAAFVGVIVTGIPGMVIQIFIIPLLYMTLKRGGFTFER